MAICENCGATYDPSDTYDAIRDYDADTHGGFCPDCAREYEDDVVGAPRDVGCDACGNPDYPACKDSCPTFDN